MKRLHDGEPHRGRGLGPRRSKTKLATGTLLTVDNQIDTATGTVKLKARVRRTTNDGAVPEPVRERAHARRDAARRDRDADCAIQRGAQGTFVYVVKDDQTVTRRAGEARPDRRRVDRRRVAASQPGELVVVDGADRLREGAKVELVDARATAGAAEAERRAASAAKAAAPASGGATAEHERPMGADRMNPSRLFILRPVATTLLMVAILLAGIVAYRVLPLSALPEVDYPTIQVVTLYPGASPDVMTSSVTAPLERQFGQMPGPEPDVVDELRRRVGDHAAVQPRAARSTSPSRKCRRRSTRRATSCRPTCRSPPVYNKVNPADTPILTLALTSKTMPLTQVQDLADTRIAQKISQLPGVGLVSISGGQRPAVRIQANPKALAAYGLSLEDLRTAIAQRERQPGQGQFRRARRAPPPSTPTTSSSPPRNIAR